MQSSYLVSAGAISSSAQAPSSENELIRHAYELKQHGELKSAIAILDPIVHSPDGDLPAEERGTVWNILGSAYQDLLLSLALTGNAKNVSAQAAALQVQVYDYAGLSPAALHEFVTRTQAILTGSGISVEVDACARGVATPCESRRGSSRQLVIRVVGGTTRSGTNVRWQHLGRSIASHHGGTYASVFLKQAEDEAAETNLPLLVVLAYAAAHEVGHLLLGDEAHTPRGLMKANWETEDFEAMAQNRLHFSPEQTRELTSHYGTGRSTEIGADTAIAARH